MPDYSKTKIQFRRGTSAEWTTSSSAGRILGVGEPAYDTSTGDVKVGDGSKTWSQLSAINGGGGGGSMSNLTDDDSPQLGGDLDLFNKDITGTGDINITGDITSTSLVKSGGTASQFLKANGTVDSNTYLQSDATGISGATAVTNIVYMSQADYTTLANNGVLDSSTIYYIV